MAMAKLLTSALIALKLSLAPASPAAQPESYPGKVDTAVVANFMAGRFAQVDVCAARARADEPSLTGSVTLWMAVAPDGSIPDARIRDSNTQNQVLLSCLVATAKTWKLPPPSGGQAQIAYTFNFASTAGPAAAGWHTPQGAIDPNAQYPDTPTLGRVRVAPQRRDVPGRRARTWGSTLFLVGWAGGLSGFFNDGSFWWFVPVIGPPIGASAGGEGGAGLAAALTTLQVGGIGLMTWGYVLRSRDQKKQSSVWSRHRMNASLSPSRGGARLGFNMSF
jgi:hypothetical protein